MEWSCQPTNENWLSITTPIQSLVHRKHNTTIVSKYMEFVLNSRQKLKRNHTLTLHLSRNKYRIEYLFVSAAATNLQYNCFALKFTFYVLWLKRNAHTHFIFSNNSKRTYMFCLSSAQKTGIRFGFFWSCHWRSRRVVWGFPHPCRVYPCLQVERPEFWC